MRVLTTNPIRLSPKHLIRSALSLVLAGLLCLPSHGGESSVRELDAYCVGAEGTRIGVAASQDGATNNYVWPLGSDMKIIRSVHSRRTVSLWHAELDLAGFDRLASRDISPPYCAIERSEKGQFHVVRWPEGQTPPSIAAVFAAIHLAGPKLLRPENTRSSHGRLHFGQAGLVPILTAPLQQAHQADQQ